MIKKQKTPEEIYLEKMQKAKENYQKGREKKQYPEILQENTNAQVFYNIFKDFSENVIREDNKELEEFYQKASLYVDELLRKKIKPEWYKNEDNVTSIKNELVMYIREYSKNNYINIEFDEIIKIANEVINTAKVRYKFE